MVAVACVGVEKRTKQITEKHLGCWEDNGPMCTACSPGGSQMIHFYAGKSGKRFVTRSTVRKKAFVVYSVCVWVDKTD